MGVDRIQDVIPQQIIIIAIRRPILGFYGGAVMALDYVGVYFGHALNDAEQRSARTLRIQWRGLDTFVIRGKVTKVHCSFLHFQFHGQFVQVINRVTTAAGLLLRDLADHGCADQLEIVDVVPEAADQFTPMMECSQLMRYLTARFAATSYVGIGDVRRLLFCAKELCARASERCFNGEAAAVASQSALAAERIRDRGRNDRDTPRSAQVLVHDQPDRVRYSGISLAIGSSI
jgi:hypothetical protein